MIQLLCNPRRKQLDTLSPTQATPLTCAIMPTVAKVAQ